MMDDSHSADVENFTKGVKPTTATPGIAKGRSSRLSALACTINNWEDDTSYVCLPSSRFNLNRNDKSPSRKAPLPPSAPVKDSFGVKISMVSPAKPKSKSPAPPPSKPRETTGGKHTVPPNPADQPPPPPSAVIPKGTVQSHRALFESAPPPPTRGAYEIPKGTVQTARARVEASLNPSYHTSKQPSSPPRAASASPVRKQHAQVDGVNLPKYVFGGGVSITELPPATKANKCTTTKCKAPAPPPPPPPPPPPMSRQADPLLSTFGKRRSGSPPQGQSSGSALGSPQPNKCSYPGLSEIKKIRVSEPKEGRIYPCLSDIECTTTSTESDDEVEKVEVEREIDDDYDEEDLELSFRSKASSLGTKIERVAKLNSPLVVKNYYPEEFDNSLAIAQIDQMLGDALEGQDYTMEDPAAEPFVEEDYSGTDESLSPASISNPLQRSQSQRHNSGRKDSRVLTSSPLEIKETATTSPVLIHTVSFYRKTQQHTPTNYSTYPRNTNETTPGNSRKITPRSQLLSPNKTPKSTDKFASNQVALQEIDEQVKSLQDEVSAQQRTISQVMKALAHCKSSLEFCDSAEAVECERVLLISTQKRLALLNEIQNLKTELILHHQIQPTTTYPSASSTYSTPREFSSCLGSLTISNLTFPLQRNFITTHLHGSNLYHFIVLVKHAHVVESSELLSISASGARRYTSTLQFRTIFNLYALQPHFKVDIEIYGLETMKEFLPHEAKYHIKKSSEAGNTPRKLVPGTPKFTSPCTGSPSALNSGITPSFVCLGSLRVDLATLQRNRWILAGQSGSGAVNPLEGSVSFDAKCTPDSDGGGGVVQAGYLSLFNDLAGYGAWKRRWVVLTHDRLDVWKYAEDQREAGKPCLGSIDLRRCITAKVGPAPREICARLHSFLLVTTRDPEPEDKNSLTMSCKLDYTAVKHLMTADSQEDREAWCRAINGVLGNLRAWDPNLSGRAEN